MRKHLVPQFKDQFEEGSIYVTEKLMVAHNDSTFKTTPHKYKFNLMGGTTIFKLKDSNEIPKRHFQFMTFLEIMACNKEDRLIGTFTYDFLFVFVFIYGSKKIVKQI